VLSEPLVVVGRLAAAFDRLGVAYLVGGSLASSVHGIPRATEDVDLVAELAPALATSTAAALARLLVDQFYADEDAMREAIASRGSFNVVHLPTMYKADVFVARGDDWSHEEFARSQIHHIEIDGEQAAIRMSSAEDTVLHKLVWYKLGDETSERQWRDVLGVLRIQGPSLDLSYVERWAPILNVESLFRRALAAQ
jgi:hypothetical protein